MEPKKRHGLVTAWLLLVILSNAYTGIKYVLFTGTVMAQLDLSASKGIIIAQGLLSLAMAFFALMVFEWKKWGFWGMLQIKKDGVSTWDNLE